ncbi:MAG: IPT/TIG domain-containing protein [Terriglobia bacterium]
MLDLQAPVIQSVSTHTITVDTDVTITVTGRNLIGTFVLQQPGIPFNATKVRVADAPGNVSDVRKVEVTFNIPIGNEGKGYSLVIENAKGKANEPNFEVVNP